MEEIKITRKFIARGALLKTCFWSIAFLLYLVAYDRVSPLLLTLGTCLLFFAFQCFCNFFSLSLGTYLFIKIWRFKIHMGAALLLVGTLISVLTFITLKYISVFDVAIEELENKIDPKVENITEDIEKKFENIIAGIEKSFGKLIKKFQSPKINKYGRAVMEIENLSIEDLFRKKIIGCSKSDLKH